MKAPLYEALCTLAQQNGLRMHMPGHKGKAMAEPFSSAVIDYTEIPPTGNLYTGEGPIALAEAEAARAWGAQQAYFLTCGSSQGIQAGLALCAKPGSTILLDRNTHKSFFCGMALLDLHPVYLQQITPEHVEKMLSEHPGAKAVCLTSPTYYGVVADIEGVAAVCRTHGVKLLVDEAHGAHFPFVGRFPCAVGRGASVSVSSAHKTLPALGSSALLFTDGSFPAASVREKTAMFGTSSPSYPIMASIDWARAWLEEDGGAEYYRTALRVKALRQEINERGVFHALCEEDGSVLDPGRLTVYTACAGLSGTQAGKFLEEQYNIWPEMDNRDCVVFILTASDSDEEIQRLSKALQALEQVAGEHTALLPCPLPPAPQVCMSIRKAVFSPRNVKTLKDACGSISAASIAPYPPGVPVVAPGERITREILDYFEIIGYDLSEPVSLVAEGVACDGTTE